MDVNIIPRKVYLKTVYRVSSDLKNLEKLEMSGNLDAKRKSQQNVREFCVKFIFSQYEHPNFENFRPEHAPRPPEQS